MAIYQRDNISYGGMLGNAMANRANYLQRRYDRVAQIGQNWGNAVQQTGNTVQDALYKIAGNYYDQDKLAAQQQFQAEQNALNRANQIDMANEQRKWQEQQNQLNRDNAITLANISNKAAVDERQAQNVMNYQNQEAIIKQLQFEYDNTSDKTPEGILKRAQLRSQIEQANNKLNYYGGLIPSQLRPQPQATNIITGPDAEKALAMFGTEAPKTAAEVGEENDKYAEVMKGKWTNANKAEALRLAGDNQAKLQEIANKGLTIEESEAAAAKELADANAQFARNGIYDSNKFKVKITNGKASLVRK